MLDMLNRLICAVVKGIKDPRLVFKVINSIKQYGIRYTIKKIISPYLGDNKFDLPEIDIYKQDTIYILTTKHCYFIARLLQINFNKLALNAEIIFKPPKEGFGEGLHCVICPQMFNQLPNHYVAFQLEQSVSSRWFTPEYIDKLKNAYSIFDYSLDNITYLQTQGLSYRQIYFMPLAYQKDYFAEKAVYEQYDVLFYGDINNQRRKAYLDVITKRFKTKVIKNVFADELYKEISKAKIIVNIHYYDDALLETTRLYECLSLNKLIISETSVDLELHDEIKNTVDFVDVGDIDQMCQHITFWLTNSELREKKIKENSAYLQQSKNMFEYYFMRFMLANDWLSFADFYKIAGHHIEFKHDFICLGLPESTKRTQAFMQQNHRNIQIFPGLRHKKSWLGCGMSYKFILQKAKDLGLYMVTVCEDDVEFFQNFEEDYIGIKRFLAQDKQWDLFSGLIADVSDHIKILKTKREGDKEYIYIDKMTSMVFNIYSHRFYDKLLSWDEKNHNVEENTIDRYLESHADCVTITTIPYLVGHKENIESTLWGIKNDVYSEMIKNSERKLTNKVTKYKDDIKC